MRKRWRRNGKRGRAREEKWEEEIGRHEKCKEEIGKREEGREGQGRRNKEESDGRTVIGRREGSNEVLQRCHPT